jgi:predicted Zn-dependent peptidase
MNFAPIRPKLIGSVLVAMALAGLASAAPPTSAPTTTAATSSTAPADWPTSVPGSPEPSAARFALPSGLRVTILRAPRLRTLGIYTYLPGGLIADDPKRTMWSRLTERLVTQTDGFSTGTVEPSFTRLETRTWPEGLDSALDEQLRLLRPMPFKKSLVELYREDVIAEAVDREQVARKYPMESNLGLFQAAEAAFAQAWRHGRTHVSLDEDLGNAEPAEAQAYYDRYWRCKDALLCVIGDVEPSEVEAAVRKRFSWPMDDPVPRASAPSPGPKNLHVTWDLSNRYFCMAWPSGERSPREQAALAVARCILGMGWGRNMNLYAGLLEARINLRTPEGRMIWLGVSLRPDGSFESARETLEQRLDWLHHVEEDDLLQARKYAAVQLSRSLGPQVSSWLLEGVTVTRDMMAMVENQQDLSSMVRNEEREFRDWCDLEWYYGETLPQVRREVERIRAADLARVAEKFLSPRNAITVTIAPRATK